MIFNDKRGSLRNIELFEKSSFFRSLPLAARTHRLVESSTVLSATEKEKPQPGLTPDRGFLITLSLLPLEVRDGLS